MLHQLSEQLDAQVQNIIDQVESNVFYIEYSLYVSDHPEVVLEDTILTELTIDKNFTGNYLDDIDLVIMMPPSDYMKIQKHAQDLYIDLIFRYVDPHEEGLLYEKPPITLSYRAIIKNNIDLAKQFHMFEVKPDEDQPSYEGHHAARMDVMFQLMPQDAYDIRHKHYNGIFKQCTVKEALVYIAKCYGIKNISIVEPDNQTIYNHIVVPPGLTFATIFDFIQERYGVYLKGFEYYYDNATLYIWPPYELDPVSPTTLNLFNVPEGYFVGLKGYHIKIEDDIYVVSNTPSNTLNITELGAEKEGNSVSFIRADSILDQFHTYFGSKGVTINKNNTISLDTTSDNTIAKEALYQKYQDPTINQFKETSKLERLNATKVMLGWIHSTWTDIRPGQRLIYHYDDEGRYNVSTGQCGRVKYTFSRIGRESEYLFDCTAAMSIRIEP